MRAALPAVVVLTLAVGLGLWLGWLALRRVRRPVLVGLHLVLGAAGIETTVLLLRGTPDGDVAPAGSLIAVAAGLFAAAMVSGLAAPLIAKQSRTGANAALVVHAGVALAGFLLVLLWLARLQ